MLKQVLSVFAGIIVAMAIISLWELFDQKLFPAPSNVDFTNAKVLHSIMSKMPVSQFIYLLAGYAVGSFFGGIVATIVSGRENANAAIITGGVVMIGGIMDLLGLPHPLWFSITSLLLYIPFAFLGYLVSKNRDLVHTNKA